ncbi:hypothetical protein RD792_001606 [Penstemon davidsonii]|uniref:Cop9 signalosome subunit 5 C-terminal domain-containing protein n=1 Tax=Penstemon davidsonii TaxID=160366 RepID=A0ABR0DNW0_9LAMI|nr:hypothetical protein RD792_001606 [Penstemon davidsonii]
MQIFQAPNLSLTFLAQNSTRSDYLDEDFFSNGSLEESEKLEQAENQLSHSRFGPLIIPPQRKKEEESQLTRITRDSAKITVEQVHGLMSQVIKDILFNSVRQSNKTKTESPDPEPMVES